MAWSELYNESQPDLYSRLSGFVFIFNITLLWRGSFDATRYGQSESLYTEATDSRARCASHRSALISDTAPRGEAKRHKEASRSGMDYVVSCSGNEQFISETSLQHEPRRRPITWQSANEDKQIITLCVSERVQRAGLCSISGFRRGRSFCTVNCGMCNIVMWHLQDVRAEKWNGKNGLSTDSPTAGTSIITTACINITGWKQTRTIKMHTEPHYFFKLVSCVHPLSMFTASRRTCHTRWIR